MPPKKKGAAAAKKGGAKGRVYNLYIDVWI